MSDQVQTSRREFLYLLTAMLGTSAAGGLGCALPRDSKATAGELTDFIELREAWATIGRVYLETDPADGSLDALTDRLMSDLDWGRVPAKLETLQQGLVERIQTEFRDDEMERVEGWMLAPTEVRLCALIALLQES
ncbi:MAG: hypothetical protein V3W50_02945 [Thermoanaerobaculia bacterium]